MDEEKQNDGMIKKTGDALKKGAKKQAKNLAKKIIKKVIMAIGAFVLKIILPIIIAIIILTAIAEFFENLFSDESKNANAFAVKYTSSSFVGSGGTAISGEAGSEEEGSSLASIIVDINNATENGAYILTYEFKDENGNIYSDDQALTNIKNDLSEKNENLDLTQFSDSELKIIGALMYNGLMVEDSDEAELKALALFVKADIASKNLDLRKSEDTNIDALGEDEVYGTIRINKTRIEKDDNDNVKYSTEKLQFVSYEEFSNMVEQGNEQAIHSFTIDENGKIIFANWSTSETKYTYHPYQDIETILSDEEKQKISVENIKEGKEKEINIVMSTPIDVSQSITPYMMDYGLLSDLLIVTDNAEFCVDLAKTAFNSKIVINIKEELQTTKIEVQNDCIQTKLLYDYVKYEVSSQGEEEIKTETWNKLTDGSGEPRSSLDTLSSYGWFPGMNPTSDEFDAAYGETITYEWTYNNTGYKLIYRHTRNYTNWILYIKNIETTNVSLPKETNTNEEGDLINLNNNHIQEEYSDYTIDEDFTDSEIFKYTEFESTVLENNKYDIEISEVDCWYLKRHTGYQNPTPQDPEVKSNQASVPGEYSEDLQLVLETDNQEEISKDSHIEGFINQKINDYNNNYPEAKDVTCNVTSLAVKQREKTDKSTQYTTTITTYSFGEENAEDTYEQLKNVEYGNNEKIL